MNSRRRFAPITSAACCGPPALKEARRRHAAGELDAAGLAAVEDREIARVVAKQEAIGPARHHRRRIPALVVASRFSLGPRRRRQSTCGFRRRRSSGDAPRREGVRVDGRIGFSGHPMLEHFRFLARARARRAEDHDPGAVGAATAGPCCRRSTRASIPTTRRAVRGSRPRLSRRGARVRGRGLPLLAARRGVHRDALRRELSATRWWRAATIPASSLQLYARPHQHRDRGRARRHGRDPAFVPRQLQIDVHGLRRLRGGRGVLFDGIDVDGYFMEYDDERSGRVRAAAPVAERQAVALGIVTTKSGNLETQGRTQTAHRRGGEASPTSIGSASRLNAGSRRPRKAIR